jgi:hypothetical protein
LVGTQIDNSCMQIGWLEWTKKTYYEKKLAREIDWRRNSLKFEKTKFSFWLADWLGLSGFFSASIIKFISSQKLKKKKKKSFQVSKLFFRGNEPKQKFQNLEMWIKKLVFPNW